MVEFNGNPFEVAPSKMSLSRISALASKISLGGWVIIVVVLSVIGYQIYDYFEQKKVKKKE